MIQKINNKRTPPSLGFDIFCGYLTKVAIIVNVCFRVAVLKEEGRWQGAAREK